MRFAYSLIVLSYYRANVRFHEKSGVLSQYTAFDNNNLNNNMKTT